MKMRFGIGPEQRNDEGNEHGGEQSRRQPWSVYPTCPTPPWSPRWPASAGTPRTENLVDHSLRRGTACCARCSTADRCHSLAHTRSALPATKTPPEIAQFSGISTRFWSKSRSYRKQKTKPCLPGSRIAQCHARSLRDFSANFAPAELRRGRPLVAQRTTKS
jgi:hypothetical protein